MARRGVFELRHVLLRYELAGGSSAGVRSFVETDLVDWARAHPFVRVETQVHRGHPNVIGQYVTGYERQLDLKNRTRADVGARFAYLRNTLGRLVPLHRRVRSGVTSSRNRSIQGMWHTPAGDPRLPPLPVEIAARERLATQGLDADSLVEELGLEGFMRVLDRLATEREVARAGGGGDVWWDGGQGPDGVLLRRSGVASLGTVLGGTPSASVAEPPPGEEAAEQASR
ncbi:hypothetical protein I4F81_006731 [Pyropia yezoensis]|uniref:Uncharacterized protein n=1 Tax=Pyropia yezoensis TaxID=2788 RepID=A0ACC3C1M5_PYRYE|nr:hypothetical protein I4F81_006731 [Neopyropia yezoensis]|eukprot:contig_1806_g287